MLILIQLSAFDCQSKTAVTVVVSLLHYHKIYHDDHYVCEKQNNLLLLLPQPSPS
jgi:hypothetical protein